MENEQVIVNSSLSAHVSLEVVEDEIVVLQSPACEYSEKIATTSKKNKAQNTIKMIFFIMLIILLSR